MISNIHSFPTLQPYLNNKLNIDPCEFHTPRSTCSPYPTSWADPRILSKTESHQITRKGQLPKEVHKIIHGNPQTPCRVYFDMEANIAVISTLNRITILNYKSKDQYFSTALSDNSNTNDKIVPYFDIYVDNNEFVSYISVTARGKVARGRVKFSQNCFKTSSSDCQMELSPTEHVTVVKLVHPKLAFIGTSTGDCYLLYYDEDNENEFTVIELNKKLYSNTSTVRYYLQNYRLDMLTRSLNDYPLATSEIMDITTFGDHFYISNKTNLTIWRFSNNEKLVCVSNNYLMDLIINRVTRHIPSHINKADITCEVVAIKFLLEQEFVILVSYTVPEMKGLMQYLVIKFCLNYDNEGLNILAKYSTSVPYTTHPSLVTRPPHLAITKDLAFISFEQSVIIVSLTKKSIFEEFIALNDPKDEILFIKAEEDQTKQTNTAFLFTANSGVLEVNVDLESIQSLEDDNIFAGLVYEFKDRNTNTFKLRLEQALFFGTPESLPLKFPFEAEEVDVAGAVLQTAKEIFDGRCIFMPVQSDFDLYMEARYYFLKRIITVIKNSIFSDRLEVSDRRKLFSFTEKAFIAYYSYKQLEESIKSSLDPHEVTNIIREITDRDLKNDTDQLRSYFIHDTATLRDLLREIAISEATETWDDVIINIVDASYNFELEETRSYDLERSDIESISVSLSELLPVVFDYTLQKVSDEAKEGASYASFKKKVEKGASLILNIAKEDSPTGNNSAYYEKSQHITEKLRSSGLQDLAITLAHERHDTASMILCLYQSHAPNLKEQNSNYISTYGCKYFNPLVDYLTKQQQTSDVYELSELFPELILQYFEEHAHPKIAWVYFLQQKDYERALVALNRWSQLDVTDSDRRDINNWLKLVTAAVTENRKLKRKQPL